MAAQATMMRIVMTAGLDVGLSSLSGITPARYPASPLQTFASTRARPVRSHHAAERHAEALSRCGNGLHRNDTIAGGVDRQGPREGGRAPAEAGAKAGRRSRRAQPEEHRAARGDGPQGDHLAAVLGW